MTADPSRAQRAAHFYHFELPILQFALPPSHFELPILQFALHTDPPLP